jgi:hypothetical protein
VDPILAAQLSAQEQEIRQEYARVWMTLPQTLRNQLHEAEIDFDVATRRLSPTDRIKALKNRIEYFKSLGAK